MVTPNNQHPSPTPACLLNHDNFPLFTLDARRGDAIDKQDHVKSFFVRKIMITNVRSLTPKIDKEQKFLNIHSIYHRNLTKASYCGFCYRYTRIYCSKDSLYLRNDYSMYTELHET